MCSLCSSVVLQILTFTFLLSAKALIQFPRANKDLLILAPSRNRAPRLVVTVALSDPAKSINDILATFTSVLKPLPLGCCLTNTYKGKQNNSIFCLIQYDT